VGKVLDRNRKYDQVSTSSECSLETKQSKEEQKVLATILGTCLFKFETKSSETCEIKLSPTENSERSDMLLADGGLKDENVSVELALTGVTTTVNAACETAGIKSTHTGDIKGFVEVLQATPQVPAPQWGFAFPGAGQVPFYIRGLNNTTRVQVVNRQAVASAGPGTRFTATIETDAASNPFFTITNKTVPECQAMMYARNGGGATERCTMTATYVLNSGVTIRFINLRIVSAGGALEAETIVSGSNS
jgi:hypothetical protein